MEIVVSLNFFVEASACKNVFCDSAFVFLGVMKWQKIKVCVSDLLLSF